MDNSAISPPDESSGLEQLASKKQLQSLLDHAYQYLMRREHSEYELRQKLSRWDQLDQIDEVISCLQSRNAQSDLRYAEHLVRVRVNAGKGPMIVQQELAKHRIESDMIEQVMAEYEQQWPELAANVRQKKFGPEPPASYKEWAKQARFLQQRGFSSRDIPTFDD